MIGLSDTIRQRAVVDYVKPALQSGSGTVTIRVKDLMRKLESEGFPPNHPAQFCTALLKRTFLKEQGLALERKEGPASGRSTTVVFHFRFIDRPVKRHSEVGMEGQPSLQDSDLRAENFVRSMRGLLKEELSEFGGAVGFLRWIRSENER